MNRIVLLGNGFDLAHGLPTKYSDFIFSYLKQSFRGTSFTDENLVYRSHGQFGYFTGKNSLEDFLSVINDEKDYIKINYKNEFLGQIINEFKGKNWIDLENYYYQLLRKLIYDWSQPYYELDGILKLNREFESVKQLLEQYLQEKVIDAYSLSTLIDFENIFNQPISDSDLILDKEFVDSKLEETLFLNFNYTETIEPYLNRINHSAKIINIHGQVNNENNSIVFGFGDELDQKYIEIERLNENEMFRHVKSFRYMLTPNYSNLSRFIEFKPFQVLILGHSCGLSDRTMLNYLFEHDHCKSIKIYHHKTKESYINTTYEISRHFRKDKNKMRQKIVSFKEGNACPQVQLKKISQ
jgi:hypothetical protein